MASPASGRSDAPITIVEFSDYQCPYCTRWHEETYQAAAGCLSRADPLRVPQLPAVVPSECHAQRAGRLVRRRPGSVLGLSRQALRREGPGQQCRGHHAGGRRPTWSFATDLALDTTAFETCLTSEKYTQQVKDDMTFANSLPTENGEPAVGGTPTFFINGQAARGRLPARVLQADHRRRAGGAVGCTVTARTFR